MLSWNGWRERNLPRLSIYVRSREWYAHGIDLYTDAQAAGTPSTQPGCGSVSRVAARATAIRRKQSTTGHLQGRQWIFTAFTGAVWTAYPGTLWKRRTLASVGLGDCGAGGKNAKKRVVVAARKLAVLLHRLWHHQAEHARVPGLGFVSIATG